ncbi:uncharacterized protein LOC119095472 [Pollicipes pollicipes]|uniref:uncharacterized protein LOC119095472 n=1 Tax=Pollicipes pollicipes TaxID=41117 RepID=UPI0018850742|nr:uncharacterized protein LOC119095472 [Pollicipes pollicipes]
MAVTVLLLSVLTLVTPSISLPLPQDVSTAVDSDVVFIVPGSDEPEKPPGYQYQQLNPADGSYKFAYENEDGGFRVEQRLGSGQLRGIAGTRAADGTVVDGFRYSYEGYGYKQEPYTSEQVPTFLRSAAGPEGLPQLVRNLQLFPEYFS